MRCLVAVAGVIMALVSVGGCAASSEAPTALSPELLAKASLECYWQAEIPLASGERVRKLWRLDENVYALTTDNRLVALSAATGRYRWAVEVAEPGRQVFAPCHADGILLSEAGGIASILKPPSLLGLTPFDGVMINTVSRLTLIDRATGKVKRRLEFKNPVNTGGDSDGVHFYVGSASGHYHAVRLSEGLFQWSMSTGDLISAAPAVFDRQVYVASTDGSFSCVRPTMEMNRRQWKQQTQGPISAAFVVEKRGAFVASRDHALYAYEPSLGEMLWQFRAEGPLRSAPQVGQRTVFVRSEQDRFYALDVATGRKRWDLTDGVHVVAVIGSDAYVLSGGGDLLVVEESIGKVKLALPTTGLDFLVPNARVPVIYVGTSDGRVGCLRASGAKRLTASMLRK